MGHTHQATNQVVNLTGGFRAVGLGRVPPCAGPVRDPDGRYLRAFARGRVKCHAVHAVDGDRDVHIPLLLATAWQEHDGTDGAHRVEIGITARGFVAMYVLRERGRVLTRQVVGRSAHLNACLGAALDWVAELHGTNLPGLTRADFERAFGASLGAPASAA